ncbi:MAG: sigma-54-dependent Fis family transcriptional regulator [Deltaproteobacteria bacterium]|nr:sigma-54-dependent Fis family transcriptional regulator [Deltaproteobacteria bacterium]MBW2010604.1 sigma-54-dependent Fis family transcriptional regulator [Deltaproteobacteria bacterium]MBW2100925.1 sigma-54-dependent Fis family transcriptional regulator [Deltaproteobacteria bacterium]
MFPTILIVDDEPSILQILKCMLADENFEVITASNGYEALKIIEAESPDLVLLDIWLPGIDGIETLKEIKKNTPYIPVIMITGHGTIETAVSATKFGAYDFIEKPLSIDKIIMSINNALNFRRLEEENKYLRKKTIEKNMISGNSPAVAALKKQIAAAAPTDAWVLITGKNGTGKELVARTIHYLSNRAEQPLIDVNCAAIPEELMENELFGYEKGAFAGATTKSIGKFELANNGTLFLDEVGDMDLKTQAKILRVLQEQQIQRVGGIRTLTINVRIIAASNKDLEKEIVKGNFREDLYFRLNVIPIEVPSLRDRFEDIPILVETFLNKCTKQCRRKKITEDALELLSRYSWPGNVRELKNLVERLIIMVQGDIIDVSDIPAPYNPDFHEEMVPTGLGLYSINHLKNAQKAFEKEFIRRKLLENENNIKKTAEIIGVDQSYLRKKLNF